MNSKQSASKTRLILLWKAQIILASGFIWAGYMKLFQAPDQLAKMWPWTAEHPVLLKLTGILDSLAALGLTLPIWLKIMPRLTVYTAYGAIFLMLSAMVFHIGRGEFSQIGINVFFALLALWIILERRGK